MLELKIVFNMLEELRCIQHINWFVVLQINGYGLSATHMTFIEMVHGNMPALTPIEVDDEACKHCPGLGLAIVYRTIEKNLNNKI
jgi:hypothetical protein